MKLVILLNIILCYNSFAQNYIYGYIYNSETKKPIPYCNIYTHNKGYGTISNHEGVFFLELNRNSASTEDSITISNIIFKKVVISVLELLNKKNDTIWIKPNVAVLPEVIIRNNKCIEKSFGVTKIKGNAEERNVHFRAMGNHTNEYAVFIENENKRKKSVLKSVLFNIIDSSITGYLFRVHIYSVNIEKNIPDKDLLSENIIQRHPLTDGWIEVDLQDYNISLPDEGVFIGIEFLDYFINPIQLLLTKKNGIRIRETNGNIVEFKNEDELNRFLMEFSKIEYVKKQLLLRASEYKNNKFLTWSRGIGSKYEWRHHVRTIPNQIIDNVCIYAKFCISKR